MARSSLHVSDGTRRRLARYKLPGMSYDDVLTAFMDASPPDAFRERWHALQLEAARRRVVGPGHAPESGQAGADMEKAFRLFELARSDA